MGRWRQLFLTLIIVVIVSGSAFSAGVTAERSGILPGSVRAEPPELVQQFSVFWQAWDLVQQRFVDRSVVDSRNMTYGAIEGMLAALGDNGHTRFLTPEETAQQSSDIQGQFQGIGAELGTKDGYPMIVAPLDGSPAQEAGIQAGDLLISVDGEQVMGMSLERVVRMVRGPEGTKVTLMVLHPGEMTPAEITIVRAKIQVHPISWTMIPGTKVAHLRIGQFNANVGQELTDALKAIRSAGAEAMVLDVRSNTGGLLDQCIAATSQFLKGGDVLVEQDARGNRKAIAVQSGGQATDIPLVVLINRGTASAAEILAGAIQDNERGKLVGETTFGTGTVLSTFQLSDGSALLLGTSQWLTPKGRQIWKQGIKPDVEVSVPAGEALLIPKTLAGMSPDEVRSAKDAQLMKALELLGIR
ncbi:MAG: S41 family peptidase [Chloroflexota bacterium]